MQTMIIVMKIAMKVPALKESKYETYCYNKATVLYKLLEEYIVAVS
jgi:hypothetical protein